MEIDLLNFSGSAKKAYQLQERGSHEQWANQSEVIQAHSTSYLSAWTQHMQYRSTHYTNPHISLTFSILIYTYTTIVHF